MYEASHIPRQTASGMTLLVPSQSTDYRLRSTVSQTVAQVEESFPGLKPKATNRKQIRRKARLGQYYSIVGFAPGVPLFSKGAGFRPPPRLLC